MNLTKRIVWADALRGLLILIVVFGHSLQHGNYENNLAWNIIYSFHMAAFFVISGYVGYKEMYKISSLWGKARQLLLPFTTWTILGTLINGEGISRLINALLLPDTSYWFVFVLFVIISFFYILLSISRRMCIKTDVMLLGWTAFLILVMILSEFRLFGFQFISYYFGFYILGYMLRKYNVTFTSSAVVLLGIIWFLMALFWKMHSVPLPFKWVTFVSSSILTYSYRYVTALFGSLFFVGFAMKFMNVKTNIISYLSYFGKISLGIYIAHIFIGRYVYDFLISNVQSDTSITFIVLDFFIRLILSIFIVWVLQRNSLLAEAFLGKRNR